MNNFDLSPISKAIAGGIVAAIVGLLARYGFQPDAPSVTAAGVIVTALISYVVGHVFVFFAPKNSTKI